MARNKLWEDMRAAGLVIKEEPYTLNVPRSQRGGEIVEPMISTQWFISIKPLAEAALQAVRDNRIRIIPEHYTKVYYNWLEHPRLVHLTPVMVGAPDPGMVLPGLWSNDRHA